jgi:cytochrome bd-type quinol oxidase subunit 2
VTILKKTDSAHHHARKKVHRIAAVLYLVIMAVVVGMTYLSEQQKLAAKQTSQDPPAFGNMEPIIKYSNLDR